MGKRRKRPDIEQREREREARRIAEEKFNALLEEKCAGDLCEFLINPEEYGGSEYFRKKVGYPDYNSAFDKGNSELQNVLYVVEYDGVYYLMEEYVCGNGWLDFADEIPEIYHSEEEVKERIEQIIKSNIPPAKELISDIKAQLPYDPSDVYIKYWGGMPGSFRVYYKQLLVIEHLYDLTAKAIEAAVEKLASFLEENEVKLMELYKLPREWNDNQRYYLISGSTGLGFFCEKIHIPSRLQGRERCPIDVILQDKSGFLDKIRKNEEIQVNQVREQVKSLSGSSGGSESILSGEEKLSLLDYLIGQRAMSCCDGTLKLTELWMDGMAISGERKETAIKEIKNGGGYCDCEVLMNYLQPENDDTDT